MGKIYIYIRYSNVKRQYEIICIVNMRERELCVCVLVAMVYIQHESRYRVINSQTTYTRTQMSSHKKTATRPQEAKYGCFHNSHLHVVRHRHTHTAVYTICGYTRLTP